MMSSQDLAPAPANQSDGVPNSKSPVISIVLMCVSLNLPCGVFGGVMAQAETPAHALPFAAVSTVTAAAATVVADPSPDSSPVAADVNATELCRGMHFTAYSTLPGGQKTQESVTWDNRSKTYLVRGPQLAMMLDDPGVSEIPSDADVPRTEFRIAVRAQLSRPIDRFCQYNFQEMANCDAHGDIVYTQLYTDCELQTYRHVVKITPDQAGTLPLLALRFQDVRGIYSDWPLYLAADSDLRTTGRSAR